MAINVLRGLFVLLMAAVGFSFVTTDPRDLGELGSVSSSSWLAMAFSLSLGVLMVVLDIVSGRRKLAVFSGVAFGILVGLTVSYALSFGVKLLVDNVFDPGGLGSSQNAAVTSFLNLLVGTIACYFSISFVLQTKDDVRFIIPYVEFRRDTRGTKPIVVDTSALMDTRLPGVVTSGFIDGRLVVPQSVVGELQLISDHPDRAKAERARDGLDRLAEMQRDKAIDVRIFDDRSDRTQPAEEDVDGHVIDLARQLEGRVLSVDANLGKVARLAGVSLLNLNDLTEAVRMPAVPGDELSLHITRRGNVAGQGVGHLPDGTMVVVEHAADDVGDDVTAIVTNATQTSAGRMIFAKRADDAGPKRRRKRSSDEQPVASVGS
ncbi:MAG: TRAM domain-containing protein [Planctomycetota bacterium]